MSSTPRSTSATAASPPQPSARRRRAWRIVLILLLVTIGWLAFSPNPPPQADTGWDKMNHLLAFSVLTACACFAWAGTPWRFARVTLALLAYGVFIEVVQTQIPGRSGEWPDLLADSLGIAIGLLLVALLERLQKKLRNKGFDWLSF
jgi:VanZ family protein